MSKPIIHIGYPKTATSWIKNYFYPLINNANIIYYDDIHFDASPGKDQFEVDQSKILDEKEFLIIVAHVFSGLVNLRWEKGKYQKFFLRKLKSNFPDASIVLFIRNQFDFIISGYSSYLKLGGTYKFQELFSSDPNIYNKFIPVEYFNYVGLIDDYREQFGSENVHVFVYEDLMADNREFLKNYIDRFAFDIDINKISYAKPNQKLRTGLASFVRHSNMLFAKGPDPKNHIVNMPQIFSLVNDRLDKMNHSTFWGNTMDYQKVMGEELVEFYNNYYKDSNNILINKFGLESIKKYNYPL